MRLVLNKDTIRRVKLFRKYIFWFHLICGLVAGVVIAIMSATGIAIAFEEEILRWCDREVRVVETASVDGAMPLPLEDLVRRVGTERPGFETSSVTLHRDPELAWEFYAGRDGPLYVDPFSGRMRDSQAHDAHETIHKLEEWHRWLGSKDDLTSTGRLITGVSNIALVLLCVSGLYLWFPRKWSARALRAITTLNSSYKGKARDFNWHNVFGFWSLPVLLVLSVTAVAISFEWGHRLVFTLAGEKAPESRNYGMMVVPPPVLPSPVAGASPLSLDAAIARVAGAFPEWETITLEIPSGETPAQPLDFGVTVPDHMPSRAYIPVKSDPSTGEILQAVRSTDRSPGLQARVWMRFLHTGGAFGLPGKIIACLGCVAALVLVWTGVALSWRRFAKKLRKLTAATSNFRPISTEQ